MGSSSGVENRGEMREKHLTPIFPWISTVDTASTFRYTESARDIYGNISYRKCVIAYGGFQSVSSVDRF